MEHLAPGKVLYSPGDPGDALYIVNRGVLELFPPNSRENAKGILLERGDVVGEAEAFGHTSRMELVRVSAAVSLQCFPRINFPELLRSVPAFYYYLCQQMAMRLQKERKFAGQHGNLLELGGQLSNFDLTTIHQAIVSSGHTGELTLRDEDEHIVGAFYFAKGHLRGGWFHHLIGQEAFWQLFLTESLSGSFLFVSGENLASDEWLASRWIDRNDTELLLTALQFRDELHAFKSSMDRTSENLRVDARDLQWDTKAHPELHATAAEIWKQLSARPTTIERLFRHGNFCELRIYQTVFELLRLKQIAYENSSNSSIPVPDPVAVDRVLSHTPIKIHSVANLSGAL